MTDFLHEQFTSRTAAVLKQVARARLAPDEPSVHDLRVSIRRLIEPMRSLAAEVDAREAKQLTRRLKPVMKAAGVTRNIDVALDLCERSTIPSARAQVAVALRGARAGASQKLVERLIKLSAPDILPPGHAKVDRPPPQTLALAVIPGLLDRYWQSGEKASRHLDDATRLHRFRLDTKHLRYTLELFAPLYGRGLTTRLSTLRDLQGLLGRANDCEAALELGPVKSDAELSAWLERRIESLQSKFGEAWKLASQDGAAYRSWLRYFRHPSERLL